VAVLIAEISLSELDTRLRIEAIHDARLCQTIRTITAAARFLQSSRIPVHRYHRRSYRIPSRSLKLAGVITTLYAQLVLMPPLRLATPIFLPFKSAGVVPGSSTDFHE
jgi:hypothetical protein